MANNVAELFGENPTPAEPTPPAPEPSAPQAPTPAPQAVTPAPEPPKPVVEAPKPEPGFVPIAAILDEREKRQKLERELADLRARQPEQTPPVPVDPEQLAAHIQEQTQRALINERFDLSEERALEKYTPEEVSAAKQWAFERAKEEKARIGSSPFAAQYVQQKHPIAWAVRQQKREKLISEIGDDDAAQRAYIERRARELGILPAASPSASAPAPAAPQPAAPIPRPAAPSPSLASAPSAGSPMSTVVQQNAVMERLFGKET